MASPRQRRRPGSRTTPAYRSLNLHGIRSGQRTRRLLRRHQESSKKTRCGLRLPSALALKGLQKSAEGRGGVGWPGDNSVLPSGSLFRRKPSLIPDPGQRVRLRTRHRLLEGSFRAISEPTTADTGEVVIWVTREEEYEASIREGRPAVGGPWPAKQMEVVLSPLEEAGEASGRLPKLFERARNKQETTRLLPAQDAVQQEGSQKPWWRRVFGATTPEGVEVTSAEGEPLGKSLREFERYTRTKPPGA